MTNFLVIYCCCPKPSCNSGQTSISLNGKHLQKRLKFWHKDHFLTCFFLSKLLCERINNWLHDWCSERKAVYSLQWNIQCYCLFRQLIKHTCLLSNSPLVFFQSHHCCFWICRRLYRNYVLFPYRTERVLDCYRMSFKFLPRLFEKWTSG